MIMIRLGNAALGLSLSQIASNQFMSLQWTLGSLSACSYCTNLKRARSHTVPVLSNWLANLLGNMAQFGWNA